MEIRTPVSQYGTQTPHRHTWRTKSKNTSTIYTAAVPQQRRCKEEESWIPRFGGCCAACGSEALEGPNRPIITRNSMMIEEEVEKLHEASDNGESEASIILHWQVWVQQQQLTWTASSC